MIGAIKKGLDRIVRSNTVFYEIRRNKKGRWSFSLYDQDQNVIALSTVRGFASATECYEVVRKLVSSQLKPLQRPQ